MQIGLKKERKYILIAFVSEEQKERYGKGRVIAARTTAKKEEVQKMVENKRNRRNLDAQSQIFGDEPLIDGYRVNLSWTKTWPKVIARAWHEKSTQPTSWLFDLLSGDPERVKKALLVEGFLPETKFVQSDQDGETREGAPRQTTSWFWDNLKIVVKEREDGICLDYNDEKKVPFEDPEFNVQMDLLSRIAKYATELQIHNRVTRDKSLSALNTDEKKRLMTETKEIFQQLSSMISGKKIECQELANQVVVIKGLELRGIKVENNQVYLDVADMASAVMEDENRVDFKIKLSDFITSYSERISERLSNQYGEQLQHDLLFDIDRQYCNKSLNQLTAAFVMNAQNSNPWERKREILAKVDGNIQSKYKYYRNLEPVAYDDEVSDEESVYHITKAQNGWLDVDRLEHVLVLTLPPQPANADPGTYATAITDYESAGRVHPFSVCC